MNLTWKDELKGLVQVKTTRISDSWGLCTGVEMCARVTKGENWRRDIFYGD